MDIRWSLDGFACMDLDLENHYVLIDQVGSIKIDIEVSVRGVKPK
jgi:hypothetical protein